MNNLPSDRDKLMNLLGLGDAKTFCRKSSSKTEVVSTSTPMLADPEGFEPASSLTESMLNIWFILGGSPGLVVKGGDP